MRLDFPLIHCMSYGVKVLEPLGMCANLVNIIRLGEYLGCGVTFDCCVGQNPCVCINCAKRMTKLLRLSYVVHKLCNLEALGSPRF
jgi:hypothetical protein